jgi:hypothetical protein
MDFDFQVTGKADDVTDGAKLHSLRLKILNILLHAAPYVHPVSKAIADIIHDSGISHDDGGEGSNK